MFDVPFKYGNAWGRTSDDNRELVVVLDQETNEKVFGGENSVGQFIKIGDHNFKVVGVLDTYMVTPKYYDVTNGAFDEPESYYVPFHLVTELELGRSGNTNCWKPVNDSGYEAFLNSECVWIQFWAELPTAQDQEDYMTFLNSYVEAQKELGRFPLFDFWGPKTSIRSSQWIADAAKYVHERYHPTLSLVYLPHIDYSLQKYG